MRSRLADPLVRSSVALFAATAAANLMGFAFWLAVGRSLPASLVGTVSAATSASALAATLAAAGAGPFLLRALPAAGPSSRSLFAVTAFGCVLAALGALAVLGMFAGDGALSSLTSPAPAALLSTVAALSALLVCVDAVLLGARRASLLVVRNLVTGVLRVAGLLVLDPGSVVALLGLWAVSLLAGALVVSPAALAALRSFRERPRSAHPGLVRTAVLSHVVTLSGQLPALALPIMVASASPVDGAVFYVTWSVASAVFLSSPLVIQATLAEASSRPGELSVLLRRAIRVISVALVPPLLLVAFLARPALGVLGNEYVRGSTLLIVLGVSGVPDAVTNVAVFLLRMRHRLGLAAAFNVAMNVPVVVVSWWLVPRFGFVAAGWAWLFAQTAGATLVLVVWSLRRRSGRTADPAR